jgi:hypothetical protein
MTDAEVVHKITQLMDEEHRILHAGEQAGGLDDAQHARLNTLKVEIDQEWDLLRQRRARRHAGLTPEGAELRPGNVVEHYQQ